ncbi:MAG: Ig-like domain-containing protein [Tannerellaceae bacterium]|nr:Ig-like domain-containing protein [Tannerellaceae bacterium]
MMKIRQQTGFIQMTSVLILALFAGCAEEIEPVGEISGVVRDAQTMQPIENVDIVLTPGNITSVTDDEGTYFFNRLEIGTYKLTYNREDAYISKSKNVNVQAGKNELSFALEPIPPTLSEVTTGSVSGLTATKITITGNVSDLGNKGEVTQHGHVWSTSPVLTVSLSTRTDLGPLSKTGSFTSALIDLSPDTDYYVRAYAVNAAGPAYGAEVHFKTLSATGTVVPVKSVSLNQTSLTQQAVGKTVTLVATVNPYEASNKNLRWSSSNSSVATVTEGPVNAVGIVTFVGVGNASIVATSEEDGDKQAFCNVTVTSDAVPVTSVTLNHSTLVKQVGAEAVTLVATVRPNDASNKEVKWTSTDPSVARVSEEGLVNAAAEVTFLRAGTASIVATSTEDGAKQAYCNVTVTP